MTGAWIDGPERLKSTIDGSGGSGRIGMHCRAGRRCSEQTCKKTARFRTQKTPCFPGLFDGSLLGPPHARSARSIRPFFPTQDE